MSGESARTVLVRILVEDKAAIVRDARPGETIGEVVHTLVPFLPKRGERRRP